MPDSATDPKRQFEQTSDAAAQGAKAAYDDLKKAAEQVGDQAKEMGSKLMANAKSYLNDKVEAATVNVGGRLKSAGEALRQQAPHEGPIGRVSGYAAQSLADAGQFIENEGFEGLVSQVKTMVKENPIRSLLAGIALGFVLSRATSHRR